MVFQSIGQIARWLNSLLVTMKIEKFENIEAWQKARKLVKLIYELTINGALRKDYGLKDQLQRSSVSVMSNIAEGFGRKTDKEFIYFLIIARASAYELQSHLYVIFDLEYITKQQFDQLYDMATETIKLINGFIRYLRK